MPGGYTGNKVLLIKTLSLYFSLLQVDTVFVLSTDHGAEYNNDHDIVSYR